MNILMEHLTYQISGENLTLKQKDTLGDAIIQLPKPELITGSLDQN